MTDYRIRETGAVVTESEFRAMYPNTSFPYVITEELVNDMGADVVFEGPQPTATKYQVVYRDGVEQVEGKWYTKYSVSDMDDEAKAAVDANAAASVRATRDGRLAETDWRFRSDMTPSQDWIDYCQALRDIPAQEGFPHNVTWPTKPE